MVFASPFDLRTWHPKRAASLKGLTLATFLSCALALPDSAFAKGDENKKSEKETESIEAKEKKDESATDNNAEVSAAASLDSASIGGPPPSDNGDIKPTIMFLETGLRSDISLLYMRTTISRFQEQQDFDVKSVGPMIHAGILTHFFWKFRIGAALGYGFNYKLKERLTDFEIEEETEPMEWILGQVYTADIRLEFSQLLTDDLWLLLTPRGGIQAVVPGEHLRRERVSYEGAYNVRQGPQLGAIGGFDIGARYRVLDWLAVRLTGSYDYYSQGLLKAKRKSETVDYTALWRMSGARVGGNVGLEALF